MHAQGKGGAIVDRGDGEIQLDPQILLVSRAGAPVFSLAANNADASCWTNVDNDAVGAQAINTSVFASLNPGWWHLDITYDHHFVGAASAAADSIEVLAPTGPPSIVLFRFSRAASPSTRINGSLHLEVDLPSFPQLGASNFYQFQTVRGATVAGDIIIFGTSMLSQKIA